MASRYASAAAAGFFSGKMAEREGRRDGFREDLSLLESTDRAKVPSAWSIALPC
jgi:hypothetical protein